MNREEIIANTNDAKNHLRAQSTPIVRFSSVNLFAAIKRDAKGGKKEYSLKVR